jgi:hypothetical protein
MIEIGMWFDNGSSESLVGAEALQIFASSPGLGLGALATIVVSVIVSCSKQPRAGSSVGSCSNPKKLSELNS